MKQKITKVLKVFMAALLVFMIAAPVIVGVYDANISGADERSSDGISVTGARITTAGSYVENLKSYGLSSIQINQETGWQSGSKTLFGRIGDQTSNTESISYDGTGSESGIDACFDGSRFRISLNDAEEYEAVSAFYRGDVDLCNLLRTGEAHLVYDFADGSTVDFGNPYILDWTDVPPPDDYSQVVSDGAINSIFTPEKAYASPISFVANKLKMLMLKAGVWKTLNEGLFALYLTGAGALGYSAPVAMEAFAKFEAEVPAAVEIFTKEGASVTEEGAAMALSDAVMYISRTGGSITELPAVMNMEAESVMATGELLGGGTGNFMNAMYEFFATNQVSAEFIASNADFFTTFFSWLGADLTEYDDYPHLEPSESVNMQINIGGDIVGELPPISFVDNFNEYKFNYVDYSYVPIGANNNWGIVPTGKQQSDMTFASVNYYSYLDGTPLLASTGNIRPNIVTASYNEWFRYQYTWSNYADLDGTAVMSYLRENGAIYCRTTNIDLYIPGGNYRLYYGDTQSWNTDIVVDVTGQAGNVDITLLGTGAQYDDAGNITDYGNVTVPNIYTDGYVAPGSYAEALNQMNATATTDNPAHADSPSFGHTDGTTIKDWTDANKPQEPDPERPSSQDDFKVEDLETVFPFCIPWDVYYLISAVAADPVAPVIAFPLNFSNFGLDDYELTVNFGDYDDFAVVIRAIEALSFCVGLALVTRNLIRG